MRRLAIVCAASCTFFLSMPTNAQGMEALSGLATGQAIQQIGDQLRQTLDKATSSGDFLAVRATQQAMFILDAFKETNESLLNTAFDRIGQERQAVLNSLRNTVREINEGRVDTLLKLENTTDQLDRLVRETTFKSYPVVYRYRGSLVTPGETQNIVLTVDGYKLARVAAPVLTFRGKDYSPQIAGDRLRFELPRSLFTAEDKQAKSDRASLALTYKDGGFLGFGSKDRVVRYDLNVVTLPRQIGSVEVSYKEVVDTRQTEVWDREDHRRRSGRGGWDCEGYAYTPKAANRRFDTNATSVQEGSGNGNGRLEAVRVTETGISFRICVRRRLWDSGPGFRHAQVHATEVWTVEEREARNQTTNLAWTSNVTVQTPQKLESLLVTVKDFTGTSRTLPAAGGNAGRYARVDYDRDSNVVIVTPVIPADLSAL